ncbi:MAG: DegT/DnrJ/EryC1/StrS family aminotransferase [Desulfovibrio sp.]|nr:DegT/DnrJ/EryC1/StrS family aminotransferase [Desulfovibrio sp.]MBI4959171.1 DegT/DnrJ/EryC1/StrS family aminotransferase [Desulfovibrio sp.]
MRIPFGTLTITSKAKQLVMECLDKGRVSSGRLVRELEERIADLIGVKEAVAVSSGTDADTLALAVVHDLGAQRGDEVIIPALSFVATGNAVLHAGLTPVFVDVDPETLNIDPARIEAAITPRTRAIMPVHLMGKPADIDAINSIARRYDLLVAEDAAEAWGARYKDRTIGSLGDMGAFSLYVAHVITSIEGGVITTDNEHYAEILRSLRSHGRSCTCKTCVSNTTSGFCEKRFDPKLGDIRFRFQRAGYSCKMNELEAAVGIGGFDMFEEIRAIRHANLMAMIDGFQAFKDVLWTYREEPHELIGPHAFPFVVRKGAPFTRDELMIHLERNGVDARTLFTSIPTQCGGYEFLGYSLGNFPNAEYIGDNGIHIGVHQDVTVSDIDCFLECIQGFVREKC